jgi:hypothetical protein
MSNIKSRIHENSRLVKLAEEASKSVQTGLDQLTRELSKGNLNPGIGTKHLYFQTASDGVIEILAKSNKANQRQVISILRKMIEQ